MRMSGFWRHFEESVLPTGSEMNAFGKTQTRQREEPDQRVVALTAGTNTAQREEPDQDIGNTQYRAIPYTMFYGTQTFTEQREEPDQDNSNVKYAALPV